MSHSFSLISTLAIGFAIAWALGFVMERIKVPALVGYLLAGIIISPGDARVCGRRRYRGPALRNRCHAPDVWGRTSFFSDGSAAR